MSRAWLTNRSRAASSRQSPGTMSPAFSSTTSPGTSRSTATSSIVPSRSTSAFSPTDRRRASTVFSALACWTTSSTTLNRMMPTMSAKLVTSPVHADRPLANSRMRIRGLAKRSRSWRHSGRRRWASASFGPYLARRRSTSSAAQSSSVLPQARRAAETKAGSRADSQPSSRAHEIFPLTEMWANSRRISPWRWGYVVSRRGTARIFAARPKGYQRRQAQVLGRINDADASCYRASGQTRHRPSPPRQGRRRNPPGSARWALL